MDKVVSVISGISGQDGSYLAEYLLSKGEQVIGFSRRTSVHSTRRIDHLMGEKNFTYLEGDVNDQQFIWKLIADHKPTKFFNLAAQSHVHTSFSNPETTFNIDTLGVLYILEAIRTLSPETRFYQASTSEMFGSNYSACRGLPFDGNEIVEQRFQNEDTPFSPNSPYAIAKLAAHHLVRLYRESYSLKCCSGILFNHESPRRGDNFVTQKIIKWLVNFEQWKKKNEALEENKQCTYETFNDNITLMRTNPDNKPYGSLAAWAVGPAISKLRLGNLDASRDWGHAADYVKAMDLMLDQDRLDDFVVGTGETHAIRDFLKYSFSLLNISNWEDYVVIDPKFIRPSEVPYLCARPERIKALGWKPEITFEKLIEDMYNTEKQNVTR